MDKDNKRPVDRNDPLLRELEEEVRREQYAKLWEKYGVYAIAAAALFVIAVAGYQAWEWRRKAAADRAGGAYEAALAQIQAGKTDDAVKALGELARTGPEGYAVLARLQVAGAHAKAGRTAEAVAAYQDLANDSGADPLFRGFAHLQAASVRLAEADWTEMENRLNELLTENNPWQAPARELWGLAALKAGKVEEARDAFAQLLADPRTPAGIRERASTLLSTLVPASGAKPEGAAAPTEGTASPVAESGQK